MGLRANGIKQERANGKEDNQWDSVRVNWIEQERANGIQQE